MFFQRHPTYIPEFIEMIKVLENKGFTYETGEAVYFDISKFKNYGKLSGKGWKKNDKARGEVRLDVKKRNPVISLCGLRQRVGSKDHVMRW